MRILLLDDHGLFREGLARLLASEPGMHIVGQCASIDEALGITARETIDLILLDYDLGGEVGTNILESFAVIKSAPRILIVTAGMTEKSMQAALDAGAIGVVLKHSGPQSLIDAIRNAMKDKEPTLRSGSTLSTLPRSEEHRMNSIQDRPLTRRQSRALHAILDGSSNREMAREMNMSETSVKAVVQELFEKAGVRTRSQLVRVAIEKHSADWIRNQ